MGMTERDRKVLAVVVVLLVLGGYWFLVLGKKRTAVAEAQQAQVAAQQELDAARAAEQAALKTAKVKPVAYSRLVRLGKAIPTDKDFESLLVQVNDISVDSDVSFISLSASEQATGPIGPTGSTTCDVTGATGGATAAAAQPTDGATGSTAQTWVGRDRDKAEGAVAASNEANAKLDCANAPSLTDIAAQAAGLKSEAFTFSFKGSFYDLKSVYNGILDLVRVRNGRVGVTGRLLDINSIAMNVSEFPNLTASVQMTGYRLSDTVADDAAQAAAGASAAPAPASAPAPAGAE